jgi:hypothetical protein
VQCPLRYPGYICANSCHFDAIDPLETTLKRVCGKKPFSSIDQHREPSTSPTFQALARNPRLVPQERVLEIDLSPRSSHCRAFTDSQAALWQSAGKWLQSFDARYLNFLTDQLLDYAAPPSARAAI